MAKPTIVQLEYGTSADGYTFFVTNYRNLKFTCWYDGTNILLEIFVRGIKVSNVLHLIHGLFHENSNFKKILFHEYFYLKPKDIKNIFFKSLTGYEFVITKNSNPDELVREYYRAYNYEVKPDDLEEDILNRQSKKIKQLINKPVSE